MTISDCVRMALSKANRKNKDLCAYLGISKTQSLNNKFIRNSWSGDDLVKVADFTGGKLMIAYPDGQQILILSDEEKKTPEE